MQQTLSSPLTPLQLEILQFFAQNPSEEDLKAIKLLIANYYAEKAMDMADQIWEENGWTAEDTDRLARTRMRTPYKKSES